MSAEGELELQLRLDANGRTAYDPTKLEGEGGVVAPVEEDDATDHSKADGGGRCIMDYSSKAVLTELAEDHCAVGEDGRDNTSSEERRALLDDLLFDCEVADCGLLPRTFWVPSVDAKPRCRLEQMALEVFHHHVSKESLQYDPATSGAEWWVQIRPSPPLTGRYSMLAKDDDNDDGGDMSNAGVSFHWDKDEELRLMMGGSMYIHPHVSTVTYLTSIGAPTMVLNYRVNSFSGEFIEPTGDGVAAEGYVSWPKRGKHLSFDGRYLHAAPSDLMKEGEFTRQRRFDVAEGNVDTNEEKVIQRRHRRVTFLVNVWLNFKPLNVNLFPETMIDKLSGVDGTQQSHILFDAEESRAKGGYNEHNVSVAGSNASLESCGGKEEGPGNVLSSIVQEFTWPMGGCESKESIRVAMPLDIVRSKMGEGGSIRIGWKHQGGTGDEANCGVLITKAIEPANAQEQGAERAVEQEAEVEQTDGVDGCKSLRTKKRQKTS